MPDSNHKLNAWFIVTEFQQPFQSCTVTILFEYLALIIIHNFL